MIVNVFVNNKFFHHVPNEFLSIFCDTKHTHTRPPPHTHTPYLPASPGRTDLRSKPAECHRERTNGLLGLRRFRIAAHGLGLELHSSTV